MAVGERLRVARERQGLTVAEVADQIKLRATIVMAIEDDDFELCGGATYARGHVRSMAKVLGLDPDEIVAEMGGP